MSANDSITTALMDAINEGILVHQQGIVIRTNPALLKMMGYSDESAVLGRPITSLIWSEGDHQKLKLVGQSVPIACTLYPIPLPDGGILVVKPVITMESLLPQAESMNRELGIGTAGERLIRDLGNPLSYITTNLGFVEEELEDIIPLCKENPNLAARLTEVKSALEESTQGIINMRAMVGELTRMVRRSDTRSRVDLNEVLAGVLRQVAGPHHLKARIEEHYGKVPQVDAAPARLAQLFANVVENAIQAIPIGAPPEQQVRIRTYTGEADTTSNIVVVEIEDDGIGFSEESFKRALEPFYTTRQGSVGLGLPVALAIVRSLRGELQLEQRADTHGTLVRITLPGAKEGTGEIKTGARILIVDDEERIGSSLVRLLQSEHRAVAVSSGRAALERLLEGERFDLIFCDMMMPDMSGPELYQSTYPIAPDQAVRFVFTSANLDMPEHQAFLDSVSNLCIEKPFDFQRVRMLAWDAVKG
jgi:signal transduction histidine kinase/CheY-like chemotaxis protein